MTTSIQSRPFGELPDGRAVQEFLLENGAGGALRAITLGGIVTSLTVPDRCGVPTETVLGFDTLDPYLRRHPYFGAITGRIAGRLPGGRFEAGGRAFQLDLNDGRNHLHGGRVGLDRRLWEPEIIRQPTGEALRLRYTSPDGEGGYPGTLEIEVTYALDQGQCFTMSSAVRTDRPTPVCLTNHSYFNLGRGVGVLDHDLQVFSDEVFLTDDDFTPRLETRPAAGTPADFRQPRRLSEAVPKLFHAHGDIYRLATAPEAGDPAAILQCAETGLRMTVRTNEPCLQVYTGKSLDGSFTDRTGRRCAPHAGICLECQGHPAATGRPEFHDILLRPGEVRTRETSCTFSLIP